MENNDIITLFSERSEKAIDELANKYGRLCKRIANKILHSNEDADECVNDTYLQVWNSIPPQNPVNLFAYVCRIARNISINRLKYNSRKKRSFEIDALFSELNECIPSEKDVYKEVEEAEIIKLINSFLWSLDVERRVLFIRRYFEAESIEKLAADFEMSKSNVSTKLGRTRNKLKKYLEKEGIFYDK